VLLAVTLAVTGCGRGSPAGGAYGTQVSTPATSSATAGAAQSGPLKTETTSAGMVLASSHGLTLYYYAEDKPGSGTSVCTGGCASAWPPLTAPVTAPAGVHLPGPLGLITRPGGVKQVTLNGYPVYFYSGDKAPGQATGNGYEGAWHVIMIHATTTAKMLRVVHTSAGTVLAGSHGYTLYYYAEDKPGSGKSMCTGSCARAWPALAGPVRAPAGVRLPGKLGMITRSSGFRQATLNGYPLYTYSGDKAPGQATGNGIAGAWHVIKIKAG
jgi:predicted lipoprotein with Yx(FWY)xxD motif